MIKYKISVALMLCIFAVLAFTSSSMKSPICDEAAHHIGTGYAYIKTHDFRMTPSPPFIRILMGLPLVLLNPKLPIDHVSWENVASSDFNYQFLFVYNNNADKIVFFSRLPMILLAMILGLLIYLWAKKLYGYKAAFFALFMYIFSPIILGNAPLAMLDMGCSLFIFAATYQLYRYMEHQTTFNLISAGVLFGLAQASKITSLILYPAFFMLIAAYYFVKRANKSIIFADLLKKLIFIWVIGLLVLWATYFFEFKPFLKNEPDVAEKIEYIKKLSYWQPFFKDKAKVAEKLIWIANNVPVPLSTYAISIMGFGRQITFGDQGLLFMGKSYPNGLRSYYLLLYLIRTPIPFLIFAVLAALFLKRGKNAGFLSEIFIILPPAAIFIAASLSKLQGGIRYILPIYPFLFVWVSRLVTVRIDRYKNFTRSCFVGLCLWYIFSSLSAYPHYLAYFNEFTLGSDGYAYKITADADWGQDFKGLNKYLIQNRIKKIKTHCFGAVDISYYGIPYEKFTEEDYLLPEIGKYYAISTRYLKDVKWAEDYTPIAKIGHTIFIYHPQKGNKK